MDFNSNSLDAMFATVLSRLDAQDKAAAEHRAAISAQLAYIADQVTKTNGRVRDLERWRDTTKGKVIGVSATISLVVTLLGLWAQIVSRG